MAARRGARILTRGPNTKYGRMRVDMKGGAHALSIPNLITRTGGGLKRRLNGT